MAFLVSPGVEVKEIDMTNSVPALSTSTGAYAGQFRWGPIDSIVTVGSETELGKIFGIPSSIDSEDEAFSRSFLTAASFLKYGNTLRVVRAYDPLSNNAYSGTGDYYNNTPISSVDDLLTTSGLGDGFYAKYPGKLGNDLKVIVYNSTNKDVSNLQDYKSLFSYDPGTTSYAQSFEENANDEVSVAVIDISGYFGGSPNSTLEIFEGLSVLVNAKADDGSSNYIDDVLNRKSQYIMAKRAESAFIAGSYTPTYATPGMTAISYSTDGIYTLTSGDDGAPVGNGDVTAALGLFEDSETVDINFLFAQNFDDADQGVIDIELIDIAEKRKDCLVFLSAPLDIATSGDTAAGKTDVVVDKFSNRVSSYAVFDSSPVQVYNKYTDRYIWIPACGHIAGLCANTDLVADAWFSPGGYTRGQLRGVVKLALNPTQSQRDQLYKGKVNPIVSFPGQGIILYGDKTGISKPSAFGRINVRRLFTTLEKAIATFSKFQLFELNDEFTRAAFRSAVEPYLRNVQARRGITDFRVVCDSTNNTGDVIDGNRFVADIYIKPTYSINYITLNFIATRTGVEFNEIVGG